MSLAATLPLAYATEEVLQVQNTTYRYELAALGRLAATTRTTPETDQRVGAVLAMYFDVAADPISPFNVESVARLEAGSILLLEEIWVTRGAQFHPLPFIPIDRADFSRTLGENHLVYHGGDSLNSVYIVLGRS